MIQNYKMYSTELGLKDKQVIWFSLYGRLEKKRQGVWKGNDSFHEKSYESADKKKSLA